MLLRPYNLASFKQTKRAKVQHVGYVNEVAKINNPAPITTSNDLSCTSSTLATITISIYIHHRITSFEERGNTLPISASSLGI